jgi:hypothetical protein
MMKVFSSTNTDLQAISSALTENLPVKPTFILYFHSTSFDAAAVAALLTKTYPGVPALGCSTAGEIATGKMLDNGLVVAGFDVDEIRQAEVVEIVGDNVKGALTTLTGRFDNIDLTTHVGLILMDGLSGKEEAMMESLGDSSDLTFVGGSAGDDLKFVKTSVAVNGKLTTGAGAMALLHVPAGFDLIKTQSFCTTKTLLTPTIVDRKTRAVLEFNGKPAAQAYAEAVGAASVTDAPNAFMTNPLGLMAGDEPFVRSPQRIDGNKVHFYCSVHEGVELTLLKGMDIVADTGKALSESQYRSLVVFNCILRTLDLKKQGKTDAFGKLFTKPTIGFSTYGEAYIGHINQTATILALH